MQKLYAQYADLIGESLRNGARRGEIKKAINETRSFSGTANTLNKGADQMLFRSLSSLSSLSGINLEGQKPGAHPDFIYIKDANSTENHYITSVFIDIKGSTALFRKYQPFAVANITTTIQKAAMHTCWHFGGFIQRFHGDGLLIYFGNRKITLEQSIKNAIDAASFFTYFMKNDLKNLFLEQGVEDIYTRIGIDSGDATDVLWHLAGIGDCSEVTTCSLHTSLAAHMQGNAPGNGIMVGDHVKNGALLSPELYTIRKDSNGKEDRYIYQIPEENFNYTQWVFNWERHLRAHPAVDIQPDGSLSLLAKNGAIAEPTTKNMDYLKRQVQGYKPYYRD
jgi:class 3 adenylate cyclase